MDPDMTGPVPATLIIMTYNQRDYVDATLRSAFEQDCEPIEILISDDCSSDGTWEEIQRVASGYQGPHRVVLNRNPQNLGLMPHYNRCFELASADIIVVGGGDDLSRPDRVRKILDAFRRDKALLVFSRVELDLLNDDYADFACESHATFYETIDPVEVSTSSSLYIGATGAFHRDLLRKYGPLPNDPCYEDLILGFRASLEGRVVFIDEPLVHYRLGGISTAHLAHKMDKAARLKLRLREMRKHQTVAEQRLADARTFGLPNGGEVLRRLRRWHARLVLRQAVFEQMSFKLVLANLGQPAELLGAINARRKLLRARRRMQ